MSDFPDHLALDPQPFRDWCERQLIPAKERWRHGIGELAGRVSVDELADRLGVSDRRLYAWRFENKKLERDLIEDALHLAGVGIWEVYPDLPEMPSPTARGGAQPGTGSKISDEQVRVLHRIHVERRVSIRELGRRIYKQLGYVSAEAAEFGIRSGFKRLGLEAQWRHPTEVALTPRCQHPRTDGSRCQGFAMRGEKFCWPHHPANHDRVQESIAAAAKASVESRAVAA